MIGEFSTRDRSTEQAPMSSSWDSGCMPARSRSRVRSIRRPAARVADGDPSEPLGLQSTSRKAGEATPAWAKRVQGSWTFASRKNSILRRVGRRCSTPGRSVCPSTEADQIRSEYPIPRADRSGSSDGRGSSRTARREAKPLDGHPRPRRCRPSAGRRPTRCLREVVEADEAFVRGWT